MNQPRFAPASRTKSGVFAVLTTVLVLALPAPSVAQTVAPADLVGSWARQGEKEVRFAFRADSTLSLLVSSNTGNSMATGRWRLKGDTLVVTKIRMAGTGVQDGAMDRRVLTIKGNLLTMTRVGKTEQGPEVRVYERVDSLKVAPPKP